MTIRKGTPFCQTNRYGPRGPFESRYNRMVRGCKRHFREMEISYAQFLVFTLIQRCHYCNGLIDWGPYYGYGDGRYNLDRKDNTLGYTKENCVVCCKSCNWTKCSNLSYEEMLAVGKMRKDGRNGKAATAASSRGA